MRKVFYPLIAAAFVLGACSKSTDNVSSEVRQGQPTKCADQKVTTAQPGNPLQHAEDMYTNQTQLTPIKYAKFTDKKFHQPVGIAFKCGDDKLYVIDKVGAVSTVSAEGSKPKMILDISSKVRSKGAEQGLLGMAFSPKGDRVYFYYTGTNRRLVVEEYKANGDTIDPDSSRQILVIEHPEGDPTHQAGNLVFGPDGFLYISVGDGGPGNRKQAQNKDSFFGKILRIDPTEQKNGEPYGIPSDNPYVDDSHARHEVFALGMRNPWRFSFDRKNNRLWIGDVGDLFFEEVNNVDFDEAAGSNFGWPQFEGNNPHIHPVAKAPDDAIKPVLSYPHGPGCAVIGGFVYRGALLPDIQGTYLMADFCTGEISSLPTNKDGEVLAKIDVAHVGGNPTSFAQDWSGEPYVTSIAPGGTTSGTLYKLGPAAAPES